MLQTVTITSKRQITIPSKIFHDLRITEGSRLLAQNKDGMIILTPAEALVRSLAGSIKTPKKLTDRDLEKMIKDSKEKYFKRKYKK